MGCPGVQGGGLLDVQNSGWVVSKMSAKKNPPILGEDEPILRNLLSDGLMKNHQLEMVCHWIRVIESSSCWHEVIYLHPSPRDSDGDGDVPKQPTSLPKASWVERSLEYNTPLWHQNKKGPKSLKSIQIIHPICWAPNQVNLMDVSWCGSSKEWRDTVSSEQKRKGPIATNRSTVKCFPKLFECLWSEIIHQWYFTSEQFVVQSNWHEKHSVECKSGHVHTLSRDPVEQWCMSLRNELKSRSKESPRNMLFVIVLFLGWISHAIHLPRIFTRYP